MVLTVFFILFFALMFYLLLMPVDLYIDTNSNEYYIRLKGVAKASVERHEADILRIKLHVFFMNFYFYPLTNIGLTKKKKEIKEKGDKKKRKISIRNFLSIIKTFKVKRLVLDIDTGDCILNAKLYPLFSFLNYHFGNFKINFEERNRMVLHVQNRPLDIIKSFINFKT